MEKESRIENGHGVTLEKLVQDLKVIVDDGQQLLKSGASQLRQKAAAGASQLREKAAPRAKAIHENIRRNPYPSMAIIFGIGLAIGIIGYNLLSSSSDEFED